MESITGKTVYVLGAGASVHTGAPLLNDFLVKARNLFASKQNLLYRDSFRDVFTWIDNLRGSSYYMNFDLDNIEHVFSMAEMKKQLGHEDGAKLCSDLRRMIWETLDECKLVIDGKVVKEDPIYDNFVQKLKNLEHIRKNILAEPSDLEKDVVITFNYDVMLDYSMWKLLQHDPNYYLTESERGNEFIFKVLKLHGSTNWAECSKCDDHLIRTISPNLGETGKGLEQDRLSHNRIFLRMVTGLWKDYRCPTCNNSSVMEPFIIPPTWSKAVGDSPLAKVWAEAVKEIGNATQIVVIGYSMPQTDTFFQYLMTLGLAKNPSLHRVVVVNKDNSEAFKKRYEAIFSTRLKERGRLWFVTDDSIEIDFEKFVGIPLTRASERCMLEIGTYY